MKNEKKRPYIFAVIYCDSEDRIVSTINRLYKKDMSFLYTFEHEAAQYDMFGEKYYEVRMYPKCISINVADWKEFYRLPIHCCGNSPKWLKHREQGVWFYKIACPCGIESYESIKISETLKQWQDGVVHDVKNPIPPCDRFPNRDFDSENLVSYK